MATVRWILAFLSSLSVEGLPVSQNGTAGQVGTNLEPQHLLDSSKSPVSLLNHTQLMSSDADCVDFTNGSSLMEFSSPKYPANYPDNIDCIKIIEAPVGHVVVVQFIEVFHIEAPPDQSTKCPYDYLQARNGKFGYSPEQDPICGKQPATLTKSVGRYLWLKFHSDATVNYKGFRAKIYFEVDISLRPPFPSCLIEVFENEGDIISKTEIPLKFHNYLEEAQRKEDHIDCTWVIQARPGRKIYLRMHEFMLERPNSCAYNFVEVYDSYAKLAGKTTTDPAVTKLCGSLAKPSITSGDNVMAIRLVTRIGPKALDDDKKLSHFQANYTVVRQRGNTSLTCEPDEFDCRDDFCIPLDLQCNDKINCQQKFDEEQCPDLRKEGIKADIFIIAFLGALLVIGMCTGMFLNIFRKLKQDHQELQELREQQRKSRESGLASEAQSQKSLCTSENHQVPPSSSSRRSPIEEQSSSESRETVIHKPVIVRDSTKKTQEIPPQPQPQVGFDDTSAGSGPLETGAYGWIPPSQHRFPVRRASDIPSLPKSSLQVAVYRKPSEPEFKSAPYPPPAPLASVLIPMQFVRDCACQTRESYLMSRRHLELRAPLARAEAIEFFQGMPVRRHSRQTSPTIFPPSSASSEIGNSLERLDEEFE